MEYWLGLRPEYKDMNRAPPWTAKDYPYGIFKSFLHIYVNWVDVITGG